jgi:prepilin-type N-terminal cleavage/methylation domain-containing protein
LLRRLQNNDGFTLLELMVAALIMAITTLAMYYMFNQGQVLMMEQEHRRVVLEKAQRRLAVFKAMADQNIIHMGTDTGTELLKRDGVPVDEDEIPISANYTVEVEPIEHLVYRISIQYEWEERSGRDYQITVMDYFPFETQ